MFGKKKCFELPPTFLQHTHTREDTFVKQCHANCSISAIFPCKDDERKFSVSFFRHQCTMYTVYTVQYSIVHCALAPGILTWRWGRIRPKSCSVRQQEKNIFLVVINCTYPYFYTVFHSSNCRPSEVQHLLTKSSNTYCITFSLHTSPFLCTSCNTIPNNFKLFYYFNFCITSPFLITSNYFNFFNTSPFLNTSNSFNFCITSPFSMTSSSKSQLPHLQTISSNTTLRQWWTYGANFKKT